LRQRIIGSGSLGRLMRDVDPCAVPPHINADLTRMFDWAGSCTSRNDVAIAARYDHRKPVHFGAIIADDVIDDPLKQQAANHHRLMVNPLRMITGLA
jgi:hypothetical protein